MYLALRGGGIDSGDGEATRVGSSATAGSSGAGRDRRVDSLRSWGGSSHSRESSESERVLHIGDAVTINTVTERM